MIRSSSSPPRHQGTRSSRTATGAADFLRTHEKMAVIMPAVTRIVALQKDCAATLPAMFQACAVLQYESGQLVLSIPNAALAAKLKQQLPKLQDGLLKRGWQVNAIRLKVQVAKTHEKSRTSKQLTLSNQALSAFDALAVTLEDSPRNAALKAALGAMVRRHRKAE